MEDTSSPLRRPFGRRTFLRGASGVAVFGGLLVVGCGDDDDDDEITPIITTAAGTTASAGSAALYTRLGGAPAIKAVVEDFVTNVGADARINGFFAKTDLTNLKRLLVEHISAGTGGPEKYTGRDMKTSHAGLKIKVADFNALVEDLVKSLDKFKVPEKEKNELLAILGPMQKDIVTA
ncbi:MAG: group I truncated hemoglobin [Chloroflexota bacterium]